MKRAAKDTETQQFHVKLSEFVKLRWLQGHVSRRLKVLMGARMKAPPAAAIDMAVDMAHAVLSDPDLIVVSESAMLDMMNEKHLAAVEQAILKMFEPDYVNLRVWREADGGLAASHDGQKPDGGKSARIKYPAQMFGADRQDQKHGIKELLNKGRPAQMPMVD